jgi:hypothetical protein
MLLVLKATNYYLYCIELLVIESIYASEPDKCNCIYLFQLFKILFFFENESIYSTKGKSIWYFRTTRLIPKHLSWLYGKIFHKKVKPALHISGCGSNLIITSFSIKIIFIGKLGALVSWWQKPSATKAPRKINKTIILCSKQNRG